KLFADWASPHNLMYAVRFSMPDPSLVVVVQEQSQPRTFFDWRGPSHQLGFGAVAASTMGSLLEMVGSRLPGLTNQSLLPEYLIVVTAVGVAALQSSSTQRLGTEDMVYLRIDEHVQ